MEAQVAIGASRKFVLRNALLLYGDGSATFATLHPVVSRGETSAPYLGPGQLLTTAFLKTLAEGLGTRLRAEVLPDNVLARTPDMIAWWTGSGRELMFFAGAEQEARQLNGGTHPHPALVFKVTGRELFVRALEKDERPGGETALKTAPYYNVDAAGRVCLGSMRIPDEVAVKSLSGWRASFFQSEFTHASGAVRLTSHPGGFVGLWQSLKDSQDPFPVGYLTDARKPCGSSWSAESMEHSIHPELLRRRVRVLVVGCGGTGSAIAGGLPYLHLALVANGHPAGLQVTVMDGDTISPTNSVRQPFSLGEAGLFKAVVLVNRLNLFWNLGWEAWPEHLQRKQPLDRFDVVIGCVDTRASRAVIRDCTCGWSTTGYVLDIGNTSDSGQFILGEPLNQVNQRRRTRLRTVSELYPEAVDGSLDDDGLPSCSAAESIRRQEPFLNQVLAQHALALLARLFRYGKISYHGGFFNLQSGCAGRLPVDPDLWRRIRRRGAAAA